MSYDPYSDGPAPGGSSPLGPISLSLCLVIVLMLVGLYFMTGSAKVSVPETLKVGPLTTSGSGDSGSGSSQGPTTSKGSATGSTTGLSSFCQTLSDKFNRYPGGPAIASPDIESTWVANGCVTVPKTWTCQDVSDAYNVDPSTTTHPLGVTKTYDNMNCETKSRFTCQKLSDDYNMFPDNAWIYDTDTNGLTEKETAILKLASQYTGEYNSACITLPSNISCQAISNLYNIGPNAIGSPRVSIGTASAQGIFNDKKCKTSPMTCSNIYQTYKTNFPQNNYLKNLETNLYVQQAWNQQKCTASLAALGPYKLLADQGTWSAGVKALKRGKALTECTDFCNKTPACKMVLHIPKDNVCEARDKADNSFPSAGRHSYIKI